MTLQTEIISAVTSDFPKQMIIFKLFYSVYFAINNFYLFLRLLPCHSKYIQRAKILSNATQSKSRRSSEINGNLIQSTLDISSQSSS